MKLIITDTNIFFDIISIGAFPEFFSLDYEICTTVFVIEEIIRSEQREAVEVFIRAKEINVIDFSAEEIGQIYSFKTEKKFKGITDKSVLWKSYQLKCILLTGDKKLRTEAENQGVEVHGSIWVITSLVDKGLIDSRKGIKLLEFLKEVNSSLPFDEIDKLKQIGQEIMIPWKRHANLVEAAAYLKDKNLLIEDFKLIMVVIRDPVELDFSYYKHLRTPRYIKKLSQKPINAEKLEAAQKDYPYFARKPFTHFRGELKDFFEMDGRIPGNMKIVRFENLAEEITDLVKPYTIADVGFPHRNKSPENFARPALPVEAIQSIYNKYQWIYEKGFYPVPKK